MNQEISPIGIKNGVRTYLHLRPFVLVPDITLTIGLYPQPRSDKAIGEVVRAHEREMREVEIGNVQAQSYPDRTLVLWECLLHGFVSDHQAFLRTLSYEQMTTAAYSKKIERS